jgi:hypothetical protein
MVRLRLASFSAIFCALACFVAGCADQPVSKSVLQSSNDAERYFEIDLGIVPVGSKITQYHNIPPDFVASVGPDTALRSSCECVHASLRSYFDVNREVRVLELQIDGGSDPMATAADVKVDLTAISGIFEVPMVRVKIRFCELRMRDDSK